MLAVVLACALSSTPLAAADPPKLPALGADPTQTSVSGLSSGAYMAVQLQVAYSRSIIGAGVVAGGLYFCAGSGLLPSTDVCMGKQGITPDVTTRLDLARAFAAGGKIDPLQNLRRRRIYVFSGTKDSVVDQRAVGAAVTFFREAGVKPDNLAYVNDVKAGHAFIAIDGRNPCGAKATPYISNCEVGGRRYDQAGAIFEHIYGKLQPRVDHPAGDLLAFNQREFADAATVTIPTGMADTAFLYVPKACRSTGSRCRVHVALHGCLQSPKRIDDQFYRGAGYNHWADNNKLLVLYPQVDEASFPINPEGCWDWWGYTGSGYALKSASQMRAIMAMVKRLARPH